jgi:hypothetical protein
MGYFMNAKTNSEYITEKEQPFDWPLCYDAEELLQNRLDEFLSQNRFAAKLTERMRNETGTLLIDWVDYVVLSPADESALRDAGYSDDPCVEKTSGHLKYLHHPRAMLPNILLDINAKENQFPETVAIHVDKVSDFMTAHGITNKPEGEAETRYRSVVASVENGASFKVLERQGYRGYEPENPKKETAESIHEAHKIWKTRKRVFPDDKEGFQYTQELIDHVIELVGRDLACHIVFSGERAYWESRNSAAKVQKWRQDKLGLGWANHDHHTFRSSRENFTALINIFEKLGFQRRERFYAGEQAGWGAQVLEQSVEGIILFCDVDLESDEVEIDFSRKPLPASKKLGTIGLWVGLHGESFLDAGMHHLECRFDYGLLRKQLAAEGIKTMDPFSDFPFLTQAFTEGEHWSVRCDRIEKLLQHKFIDENQFNRFLTEGAIGSHLENLQRKGGFKGFNQSSVSVIIRETDPRRQLLGA